MGDLVRLRPGVTAVLVCGLVGSVALQAQEVTIEGRLVLEDNRSISDWRILAGPTIAPELPTDASVTPEADGRFEVEAAATGDVYVCPYFDGRLAADDVVALRLLTGAEPPEELILKYIDLGFAEEDAAIAACAEWVGAEYLISENRHFLSRSELVGFEIVNAETALSLLQSP